MAAGVAAGRLFGLSAAFCTEHGHTGLLYTHGFQPTRQKLIKLLFVFLLQVWRQGGYSDDLLLAAFCTEHGLPIGMPASAFFPQQLPAMYTAKQ